MTDERKPVIVAKIVSPFGRVGEVKAILETDYPEAFVKRKELLLTDRRDLLDARKVEQIRLHKGAALVKFEGVETIGDAEELRGLLLAVWPEDRAKLDAGTFWMDDLIGMEVVTDEGKSLGRVTEILRNPAYDVWVTKRVMVPAVKEYVTSVDAELRKITVRSVEGLEISEQE
ncbi:MAG: ribosome maturation factor RimM [Armatimonadota bacterium]